MSIKTFTGFRGFAALAEVDGIQFVILARTETELEMLYKILLPEAPAFNPGACQKSIMIQAKLLPEQKT